MLLAVDIGNTNIVVGCCERDRILFVEQLSTDLSKTELEYAISFKNVLELYGIDGRELEGGIISSVVPPLTDVIRSSAEKVFGKTVMTVGPGVKTGLNILTDNPAQVGSDLIVNAVAAINEYPAPLIIVYFGTATTLSVIDAKQNYIGGMILPGIRISQEALAGQASKLPRISYEAPKKMIGRNTVECMKSGMIYGNAACIDGIIKRIGTELGEKAAVVATGDMAKKIVPYCEADIQIDEALLMKGLMRIYYRNRQVRDEKL